MKVSASVKFFIALSLLALLLYLSGVESLLQSLSHLTFSSISLLLLLSVVLIYISALKWKLFLNALSADVPVLRLFNLYLLGYFVNQVLPSYVGGDVARSFYIGKRVGQHEAFAATILERYTGLVAMMVLACVALFLGEGVTLAIKLVVILLALGLIAVTVLALSTKLLKKISRLKMIAKVSTHLSRVQAGLLLGRSKSGLLIGTLLLSFLFHSFTVVNTLIAAHAVGWNNPPVWELFVVLPLILLIGALPISPSGLGVQEGAFFYFLQTLGATPGQALGVAVVLRAKSYVLALVGGVVWMLEK